MKNKSTDTKTNIKITDSLLISLAGKAAFERGRAYARSGSVLKWKLKGNRIVADVEGSEIYRVTLELGPNEFDGYCDCPASENADFCKHCVAVALCYRDEQSVTKKNNKNTHVDEDARLISYLNSLEKSQLIEIIQQAFENDDALHEHWQLKSAGAPDTATLRKHITTALPYNRQLYSYADVRAYFQRLDTLLEALEEHAPALPADDVLALVDYALQRINRALETVDDSGGFRFNALTTLHNLHVDACKRADWPKARLATYLMEIYCSDVSDLYPAIPQHYQQCLGKAGLKALYADVEARWKKLPALKAQDDWSTKYSHLRLQHILENRAEQEKDMPALIALKARTATSWVDYLNIADICIKSGDAAQAELWLARAAKQDPQYHHEQVNKAYINLWLKQGKYQKALDMQWQIFTRTLNLADYCALPALVKKTSDKTNWRQRAEQFLQQEITKKTDKFRPAHALSSLMQLHLHHKDTTSALALTKAYNINLDLLLELAKAIANNPADAIPLYFPSIEKEIKSGSNTGYQTAIKLLKKAASLVSNKAHQQLINAEIARLRKTHKAKRNFMALLNSAFPVSA